jgi:hypothetical protein
LPSIFTPTEAGSAVDRVKLVVVAPAAIVPTAEKLGTKQQVLDAATADTPEATARDHPFDTMLNLFNSVVETKLYTKGLRLMSERMSQHIEEPERAAFGDGDTCAHIKRSITFLKLLAMYYLS